MSLTLEKFQQCFPEEKYMPLLFSEMDVEGRQSQEFQAKSKDERARVYNECLRKCWDQGFTNSTGTYPRKIIISNFKERIQRNRYPYVSSDNIRVQLQQERILKRVCQVLGMKCKPLLLHKLQTALKDQQLTHVSLTDNFFRVHKEIIEKTFLAHNQICLSWEVNNPVIFPEIKQKEVVVSARDQNLLNLINDKKFTDAVLVVNGTQFPVHKNLFSASSEYLDKLVVNNFSESKNNEITLDLKIQTETFAEFIKYVYTGAINFSKISTADLLVLTNFAETALMPSLVSECVFEYRRRLTTTTFWEILEHARTLQNEALKGHCQFFLKAHPNWIQRHVDAESMPLQTLFKTLSIGTFIHNQPLIQLSLNTLKKRLEVTTFQEMAHEARESGDEDLKTLCVNFFDQLKLSDKNSITSEMRKSYMCLVTDLDAEEIIELFNPTKKQKTI